MRIDDPFSRGQMEWALWQSMSHHGPDDPRRALIPLVFLNRIKRLIEIDSAGSEGVFGAKERTGRGSVATYTRFHVFLMRVGLVLLDSGYKQSDVLFLLQHIKSDLEIHYRKILKSQRNNPREPVGAANFPDWPKRSDNPQFADMMIYMSVRKIELTECWDLPASFRDNPFILVPEFYFGQDALAKGLKLGFRGPSTTLVEIGNMAVSTDNWLSKAPIKKRGRKPKNGD